MTDHIVFYADAWRKRPLCCRYVAFQTDFLAARVVVSGVGHERALHWGLGWLADGTSEVCGVWPAPEGGPMGWPEVLKEIEARGVESIRFVIADPPVNAGGAFSRAISLPCTRQILRQCVEEVAPLHQLAAAGRLGAVRDAEDAALAGFADNPPGELHPAIVARWLIAIDALRPFYALSARQRRIVRAADRKACACHDYARRGIARRGSFGSADDAATFVETLLLRAAGASAVKTRQQFRARPRPSAAAPKNPAVASPSDDALRHTQPDCP